MPRVRVRDASNTLRTLARIRIRDASNTLRQIQRIRIRDAGGTLRTVWQFFSLSLSATNAYGFAHGLASHGAVNSASVTVTVTGGVAPYTYLWQYVSGDVAITPNSPTAATTQFGSASVTDGISRFATYNCKVTDNVGNILFSNNVDIQLDWADDR